MSALDELPDSSAAGDSSVWSRMSAEALIISELVMRAESTVPACLLILIYSYPLVGDIANIAQSLLTGRTTLKFIFVKALFRTLIQGSIIIAPFNHLLLLH